MKSESISFHLILLLRTAMISERYGSWKKITMHVTCKTIFFKMSCSPNKQKFKSCNYVREGRKKPTEAIPSSSLALVAAQIH